MEYFSNLDKYEDLSFVGDPVKQVEVVSEIDPPISRRQNKKSMA